MRRPWRCILNPRHRKVWRTDAAAWDTYMKIGVSLCRCSRCDWRMLAMNESAPPFHRAGGS